MSICPKTNPTSVSMDRAEAIIIAAGRSTRMESDDKLFLPILGVPLLSHTLATFEAAPSVESVILVLNEYNLERGKNLVREKCFTKVKHFCLGGNQRQDSVRNGLKCIIKKKWVIIHDGARPCLEPELIERGVEEATRWGSAIAAVPVNDTIKAVNKDGIVSETLDRTRLWAIQTPQIFSWETLHKAYSREDLSATDDATLVEILGHPVHIYFGSYDNLKVTTPRDVIVAEALLKRQQGPTK